MHSNAHARHSVTAKEPEEHVQQESHVPLPHDYTQCHCDTGIVIRCSPSILILLFNAVHSVAIPLHKPK